MHLGELFDASLRFFPVQALDVLLFLRDALVQLNDGNAFFRFAVLGGLLRVWAAASVQLAVGGRDGHEN